MLGHTQVQPLFPPHGSPTPSTDTANPRITVVTDPGVYSGGKPIEGNIKQGPQAPLNIRKIKQENEATANDASIPFILLCIFAFGVAGIILMAREHCLENTAP